MLYRYALAIACAADGDEMPRKSLSSMRDELRLVLCLPVHASARWLIRTGRRYQLQTGHQLLRQ